MSRPQKDGLDYFPLDIDMDQDDKVIVITAKYGIQGFGILIKLLMEIYKNGYFYNWTEKEQLIFSSRVSVDINTVKELVVDCIKWGLFNEEKFNQYHVLTSKGIQNRYILATSRRVNVNINDELKLVSVDINPKLSEKPNAKSTQSKVKKKKVNKSKENSKITYAEFVSMEEKEYQKLVEQFGEEGTRDRIDNLNLYKGSKGIKYQSDYMTILAWERKNKKQEPEHKEIVLTEKQQLEKRFNELDGIMSLGVGYYERINCADEYYAAEKEYEDIERKLHSYKN